MDPAPEPPVPAPVGGVVLPAPRSHPRCDLTGQPAEKQAVRPSAIHEPRGNPLGGGGARYAVARVIRLSPFMLEIPGPHLEVRTVPVARDAIKKLDDLRFGSLVSLRLMSETTYGSELGQLTYVAGVNVLPDAEITYPVPIAGPTDIRSGLLLHYRLDEGSRATSFDLFHDGRYVSRPIDGQVSVGQLDEEQLERLLRTLGQVRIDKLKQQADVEFEGVTLICNSLSSVAWSGNEAALTPLRAVIAALLAESSARKRPALSFASKRELEILTWPKSSPRLSLLTNGRQIHERGAIPATTASRIPKVGVYEAPIRFDDEGVLYDVRYARCHPPDCTAGTYSALYVLPVHGPDGSRQVSHARRWPAIGFPLSAVTREGTIIPPAVYETHRAVFDQIERGFTYRDGDVLYDGLTLFLK